MLSLIDFSFQQAEVSELKEQVAMYESASCVGVFLNSTAQPGVPSESFAQLGIRKNLDWKTPKIARYDL